MGMNKNHMLEMRNLTRVYGSGPAKVVAVDNVNLNVTQGEIVLIMGPSGSGKTTLLTMAGGLLRPTSGTVRVGGEIISSLSDKELSHLRQKKVGFIFQSFNLLSALSALENVQVVLNLANKKGTESHRIAENLLADFDLRERLYFRPHQLSGGEKQRVSIARALANDPDLVLADEPTANLDSVRGHEVMRLLRDVAKKRGKTVIIVSHDQRIKGIADRVLWMEDGKIREVSIVHDPVCGMALDESKIAAISTYKGKTYYFCALGCQRLFDEEPAKFAGDIDALPSGDGGTRSG